jgi:hypothetical protein
MNELPDKTSAWNKWPVVEIQALINNPQPSIPDVEIMAEMDIKIAAVSSAIQLLFFRILKAAIEDINRIVQLLSSFLSEKVTKLRDLSEGPHSELAACQAPSLAYRHHHLCDIA